MLSSRQTIVLWDLAEIQRLNLSMFTSDGRELDLRWLSRVGVGYADLMSEVW